VRANAALRAHAFDDGTFWKDATGKTADELEKLWRVELAGGVGHEPNRGITEVEIPAAELPGGKEADGSRQAVQLAWHEGEIDLDHF